MLNYRPSGKRLLFHDRSPQAKSHSEANVKW